jgi:uncharacterized protein YaaQ
LTAERSSNTNAEGIVLTDLPENVDHYCSKDSIEIVNNQRQRSNVDYLLKGRGPMKLIYVIVRKIDNSYVTEALNKQGFYVTKLASTGGFLREGNTTLMIGTEDEKVEEVINIVKKECGPRQQIISNSVGTGEYASMNVVNVGGATIFVVDVNRYEKI